MKRILEFLVYASQAHTVAPVVSRTLLVPGTDAGMRQACWDGLELRPKGFQSLQIPDLALRFWSRALV